MNNKYILHLIVLVFLLSAPFSQAQESKHFDINEFKKTKADFMISEIQLTTVEADAFIPLVNELMDKKFELSRSLRKKAKELQNKKIKTDADYDQQIQASFDYRAKELELDKEYYQKFRKILPAEKVYKYQTAERKFMKQMLEQRKRKNKSSKK